MNNVRFVAKNIIEFINFIVKELVKMFVTFFFKFIFLFLVTS